MTEGSLARRPTPACSDSRAACTAEGAARSVQSARFVRPARRRLGSESGCLLWGSVLCAALQRHAAYLRCGQGDAEDTREGVAVRQVIRGSAERGELLGQWECASRVRVSRSPAGPRRGGLVL